MEEIVKFLRLLYKYRIILITVPIISVICTFFLVRNLPNVYVSEALLSTGYVDETKQSIISDLNILQESKVVQKFATLVDAIKLKATLDQVSYQLILHDLSPDQSKHFRSNTELMEDLTPDARKHAIEVFTQKLQDQEALDLYNEDQKGLYSVIRSMGYDEESLKGGLNVERQGTSDYISIKFSSENPNLSTFVANTLADVFIANNNQDKKDKNEQSLDYLKQQMSDKQDSLNKIEDDFNAYKVKNGITQLAEQAASVFTLKNEYATKKVETESQIAANISAIAGIDAKFTAQERGYAEAVIQNVQKELDDSRAEQLEYNRLYIENDFDLDYLPKIDSMKRVMADLQTHYLDQYIVNPLVSKQSLIERKLAYQSEVDLARGGLVSINNHLNDLNAQYNSLVPHQAVVQRFTRNVELASREYLGYIEKLAMAELNSAGTTQLSVAQRAAPGFPEKSKKMLLVIFSFIVSVVFCLLVFFVIFFFDTSIKQSSELAEKTGVPVLGHLNILGDSVLDLKKMWNDPDTRDRRLFKDMLRSVRFETEREMGTNKKLLINSLCRGEGKTVFSLSLTYAFAMTGKRVLLIDGNFKDNGISKTLKVQNFLEDFLVDNNLSILTETGSITVLGNRGGDTSLLEICPEEIIRKKMKELEMNFDLVVIESAPLKALNVSSEWSMFADKIICVFEAGRRMSPNRKANINYLMNLDDKFIGWVLNKIPSRYLTPLVDLSWLGKKK